MKKYIVLATIIIITITGCKTVDLEQQYIESQQNSTEANYEPAMERVEKTTYSFDIEPEIITVKEPIVIPPEEMEKIVKRGDAAILQSMQDAMVTPENAIGGTHLYDYDENKQYPITTKSLAMTIIQLEPGEETLSAPYLSDTIRWEIAGDLWVKDNQETQLIMIKPLEVGLSTNMLVITNRRLYNFILKSTNSMYQPMVKFRYPRSPSFISSRTRRAEVEEKRKQEYAYTQFLSYNYKVRKGTFFPVPWAPIKVYDDGHKTYIEFPEMVLQREMPVVFEKKDNILNYRHSGNIMIIDKLVEKVKIKLGNRSVTVTKKKGLPQDVTKITTQRKAEYVEQDESVLKKAIYRLSYKTFTPPIWAPIKVYDEKGDTVLVMVEGYAQTIEPTITDDENTYLMYEIKENKIIVKGVRRTINMTYNDETVTITREFEPMLKR